MTDILNRLRDASSGHPDAIIPWPHRVLHEAADEIERLRDALMKIEYLDRPQVRGLPRRVSIQEIALAALDNNNG